MRKDQNLTAYLYLFLTVTFWAGNFIVGKLASFYNVPPFSLNFYRWFFAWLILAPFTIPEIIEKKDYIFVTDVCRAIIFLIKSNAEGIFNVGSGKSFLSKDLMSMILQQYASNIVIDHTENNKSQDFSLNIDKIFNASGWKPNISIWDGITMLLQEEKFKNPATFSNFTKTIRSFYK